MLDNRKCAARFSQDIIVFEDLSGVIFYEERVRELIRSILLSYPGDFSYRANVLATSLDIN